MDDCFTFPPTYSNNLQQLSLVMHSNQWIEQKEKQKSHPHNRLSEKEKEEPSLH